MVKNLLFTFVFILSLTVSTFAQQTRPTPLPQPSGTPSAPLRNTDQQPTPPRTQEPRGSSSSGDDEGGGATQYARTRGRITPAERDVRAAFERLLNGIRQANVDAVMGVYWNSPQLSLFNNNGTVTRGWQQVRANRESSYPNYEDVTLDVRDARVLLLSPSSAIVTCLWTQSQNFRGTPETASGRLTIVFQLVGGRWRAVHTHTSPDAPDPSRILPSERTTTTPTARPTTPPPDDPQ